MTTSVNQVESAEWEIIGNPRLSDSAISALAELALDLVEADEANGGDQPTNRSKSMSDDKQSDVWTAEDAAADRDFWDEGQD
ncbi:MAG: hypothetical protein IID44_15855 [Planctomycetes bacterium]|nr:hypothetical protein [Planctomycetota bacterium]